MKILSIAILLCLLSQDSIMAQKQNNLPLIPLPEKLIIGNGNFEINESRNDVNKLINSINKIEGQVRDARLGLYEVDGTRGFGASHLDGAPWSVLWNSDIDPAFTCRSYNKTFSCCC